MSEDTDGHPHGHAAVLNLFGGILIQKRRAEVALENSGLNYVIVRPGGMERPTDSYKDTHNVRLSAADTLFGGQVSHISNAPERDSGSMNACSLASALQCDLPSPCSASQWRA